MISKINKYITVVVYKQPSENVNVKINLLTFNPKQTKYFC